MLTVYKILTNIVYLIGWPYLAYQRLKKRKVWQERGAFCPEKYLPQDGMSEIIWGHASSVGEVRVLSRLFAALRQTRPDLKFCISAYTTTGHDLACELFPDAVSVFYFPLDSYFPLKRFFGHFHPRAVIMVETEIWPYFLDSCRRNHTPLVLANGRLSEKSSHRYRPFRRWLAPLLNNYRKLAMQTNSDAERMIAIGALADRVVVTGNIKHDFDAVANPNLKRSEIRQNLGVPKEKLLLIAGSTRPGEEETICQSLKESSVHSNKLTLLLAPRHLERLEEVKEILNRYEFPYVLHSELETGQTKTAPVILMDRMGLLADLFYGADLAFVGGTLADLGGHNLMEPVAAGVPVLFGPSLENVRDAASQILQHKQGLMVHDAKELSSAIDQFAQGRLTFHRSYSNNSAAAEKTAEIIIEELSL